MPTAILTCGEIRECEIRAAEGGLSLDDLMAHAGEACAVVLDARAPERRVVVLAGPGNNGGDAFVAAKALEEMGRDVLVCEIEPAGRQSSERQSASEDYDGPRISPAQFEFEAGDVILDGLYGAGLSRPLSGEAAALVERINAGGFSVIAIDVPSGIKGDQGEVSGPALRSELTVTFGAKKPAHLLQPAASLCGEVHVAEIGLEQQVNAIGQGRLMENGPDLWADRLRWPTPLSHKHLRGRLMVVSGGPANTGAARLAGQAGLRIGAGAVTLLTPPAALMAAAGSVKAVMTSSFAGPEDLVRLTERASTVVIGPAAGVGEATRKNVDALIGARRRLVLDADALTIFADDPDRLKALGVCEAVLTPHAGEFERIFPGVLAASATRIEAARTAAARIGAVVLLKGFDSVIAAPDGRAVVNAHASPFLATAGSGDVLAGVIGGLMAQGLAPFVAACAGAWMHGDAGLRAGPGMTAEDLDGALRATLASLYSMSP